MSLIVPARVDRTTPSAPVFDPIPRAVTIGSPRRTGVRARETMRTLGAAVRISQWTKNLLVAVPLVTSGKVLDADAPIATLLAVVAFSLSATTVYLGNDIADRVLDAQHPTKRLRPIAAGLISVRHAQLLRALAFTASMAVALVCGPLVAAACAGYVAVMEAYTRRLKHVPVIELAIVAGGFVARVLTGSLAGGIPASRWLIIVVSAAALHLVATKRAVELARTADGGFRRKVLESYPANYLRDLRLLSLGVAVVSYCLWAFERAAGAGNGPWPQLSIVPVMLAVMHYGLLAETKHAAESPDEVLLRDRTVQLCAVAWAALFAIAVVTAHR